MGFIFFWCQWSTVYSKLCLAFSWESIFIRLQQTGAKNENMHSYLPAQNVPHKAVAEVLKIANYRRLVALNHGSQGKSTDGSRSGWRQRSVVVVVVVHLRSNCSWSGSCSAVKRSVVVMVVIVVVAAVVVIAVAVVLVVVAVVVVVVVTVVVVILVVLVVVVVVVVAVVAVIVVIVVVVVVVS